MSDSITLYKQIIHGIQALRRQAELFQCPVLGGAGVRMFCYPHQLYIVRSVLESTQIRHLLADEVGLGKTLESLMIVNALRIRNGGKYRLTIVVGSEERAKQWRDEILGRFSCEFWKSGTFEKYPRLRCNGNVFFDDRIVEKPHQEEFPEDGFHIVTPDNFEESKKYLEPDRCDLLIVDEIHSFSDALLKFLASRSSDYRNLLVLSATPLFGEEKDRRQLLQLLSPEHADRMKLNEVSPNVTDVPMLQNRMLRSKRSVFPKSLPQRETKIIEIEPFENDLLRVKKSRNLMQTMVREYQITEEHAVTFIRRSVIGGQTLLDRINAYRPRYPQYTEEWTELQTLCAKEQGDARFDALVDYLLEFFADDDKTKKIIIAAQDMPTVHYLKKCLECCFSGTKILTFNQERNRTAESDLDDGVEESDVEIEKDNKGIIDQFWSGEEQILIAHNDAKESFNLQIADSLVFYSLPWNPVDMEQWLGRISRLGLRKKKIVAIVSLVQLDLIDEEIVDFYQLYNIFEKPVNIEKNQDVLNDMTKQIQQKALDGNYRLTKREFESADEWNETPMHIVPREDAEVLDGNVQETVIMPVIKTESPSNYPKEDALNGWLELLIQHKFRTGYLADDENYRDSKNPKYYKFQVTWKYWKSPISIPILEEEPISKVPFILKRTHIQLPPRDFVPIDHYGQRYEVPLQFFNFGSPLHDELVKTFAEFFNKPMLYYFPINLGSKASRKDAEVDEGKYLIGIVTTNREQLKHESLLDELPKSDNKTQSEIRQAQQNRLKTGLQADDRFLDLLLPGGLEIAGFKGSLSNRIEPEQFYDFLTILPSGMDEHQLREIPPQYKEQFIHIARESTQKRWQHDFQPLLEERLEILRKELEIRLDLLQFKIKEQERKINEETNEQTIRLTYVPAKKLLEEQLILVQRHFDIRKKYLTESIEKANRPQGDCKAVLYFDVKKR